MQLVMAAATDVGTVRETNEDFFYYSKPGKLIVVCDGMGGHQSGAVASRIAGKTIRDVFFHADLAELTRLGEDVIERLPPLALRLVIGARLANRRLLSMAERDRQLHGMGTTLVALAFSENNACVVHVGDSRLYCLRDKKLLALTEDHSLVNQLLQDRDIRQDQVKQFRKKNVLTRALGTHATVKVDAQCFPVQATDIFLLCSDGLHNALNDEQIAALLRRQEPDLQKLVDDLVQQSKTANGSDNITAAITRIEKISGSVDKKEKIKLTLVEETARTVEFEDNFIREKYLIEKSGGGLGRLRAKRSWWPLFLVCGGLLLTGLVYAMINRTWLAGRSPTTHSDRVATASSEINPATLLAVSDSQAATVTAPPLGGYLVFLHVSDPRRLERLRSQAGIRLLDQFNTELPAPASPARPQNLQRPIFTGTYSFVIVDSLQNTIYRKDHIHLRSLPRQPDTVRVALETPPRPVRHEMTPASPDVSPSPLNATKQDTLSEQQ